MSYLGRKGSPAPLVSSDIPDNSITGAKIVTDTIAAGDIGNDAVGTAELANDVVISTSGSITTTGAFTSVGIDDNADATAITIDSSERVGIGTTAPISATLVEIERESPATDGPLVVGEKQASGYSGPVIWSRMYRGGATSSCDFLLCTSDYDATPEHEFRVRNNGASYNDAGIWNTGADYAEFFEWKDGNPSDEDRAGMTVVLDGDKIRKAEEGETPIGVVSANPAVVGDVAWNKWSKKYLKDDFGRGILEEYTTTEWTDADGKNRQYVTDRIPDDVIVPDNATVISEGADGSKFERGIINPDFDDSLEYIQREKRKEWDAIGLLGKLRILKDQPVADSWIKMKNVSETVEMWFVK